MATWVVGCGLESGTQHDACCTFESRELAQLLLSSSAHAGAHATGNGDGSPLTSALHAQLGGPSSLATAETADQIPGIGTLIRLHPKPDSHEMGSDPHGGRSPATEDALVSAGAAAAATKGQLFDPRPTSGISAGEREADPVPVMAGDLVSAPRLRRSFSMDAAEVRRARARVTFEFEFEPPPPRGFGQALDSNVNSNPVLSATLPVPLALAMRTEPPPPPPPMLLLTPRVPGGCRSGSDDEDDGVWERDTGQAGAGGALSAPLNRMLMDGAFHDSCSGGSGAAAAAAGTVPGGAARASSLRASAGRMSRTAGPVSAATVAAADLFGEGERMSAAGVATLSGLRVAAGAEGRSSRGRQPRGAALPIRRYHTCGLDDREAGPKGADSDSPGTPGAGAGYAAWRRAARLRTQGPEGLRSVGQAEQALWGAGAAGANSVLQLQGSLPDSPVLSRGHALLAGDSRTSSQMQVTGDEVWGMDWCGKQCGNVGIAQSLIERR